MLKNNQIYLSSTNYGVVNMVKNSLIDNTTFMVDRDVAKERFGYSGRAELVRVPLKVDTNKLSDIAKIIAYTIPTFENSDTLSGLWCYGPSQREMFIKEHYSKEYIEVVEKVFGKEALDNDSCILWHWDKLKRHESPEQYIERQVIRMKRAGVRYFEISKYNSEKTSVGCIEAHQKRGKKNGK